MTGYKYLFCAMLLLATCSLSALAQNANNILSGVVRDQNGDVIAGAQVKVLNTTTAQTRESFTGHDGVFTVPVLPPGNYSVTLFCDGFAPVEITGITLGIREERVFRVELKVGTVREQVTVHAHAVTVSPDTPSQTTTMNRDFADKLPLNGNSLQPIINAAPGVVFSVAGSTTPGLFSANGQRPDANYFTVDGVSANIGVGYTDGTGLFSGDGDFPLGDRPPLTFLNGTQSLIASEAVESVQVQTSNYSAQYGRQPGAQIAFTSRAGTNQFNGSLFGNFRHRALETTDQLASFNLDNKIARYQQLGATLSGPLLKQRTFFFLTYEGQRLLSPQSGTFLIAQGPPAPPIHPNFLPIIRAFPPRPVNTFPIYPSLYQPTTVDAASFRLDHQASAKMSFFGRYHYAPSSFSRRNLSLVTDYSMTTETLTTGSTWLLNSTAFNEFRFNWSRTRAGGRDFSDDFGGAVPPPVSAYLPSFARLEDSFVSIAVGAGEFTAGKRTTQVQRHLNLTNNINLTKGAHRWVLGVDYRYLIPRFEPPKNDITVNASFDLYSDGYVHADVLEREPFALVSHNFSAFADDTWKVNPRLTLNLGLRWELATPPRGTKGQDLLAAASPVDETQFRIAPAGTPLWATSYRNFAPRLGFSYQLDSRPNHETVLRAGIGLFYDVSAGSLGQQVKQFHNHRFYRSTEPLLFPLRDLSQLTLTDIRSELTLARPDLKMPSVWQANVTLQHSLGRSQTVSVAYFTAAGQRLLAREYFPDVRSSRFGHLAVSGNGGDSAYHALQLQYQSRLARGWQANASYTFAKSLDTVAGIPRYNFSFLVPPHQERGPSDFDLRHNFSAVLSYEVPQIFHRRLAQRLFHNWSVGLLLKAQSGTPIDIIALRRLADEQPLFIIRPDLVAGVPLHLRDPNAPGGRRINPDAFRIPTEPRPGTLGRNALRGFGAWQADVSLRRTFSLSQNVKLRFSAEAFNVFNRTNLGSETLEFGRLESGRLFLYPASFGYFGGRLGYRLNPPFRSQPTLNAPLHPFGGPRSIQLGVRLSF